MNDKCPKCGSSSVYVALDKAKCILQAYRANALCLSCGVRGPEVSGMTEKGTKEKAMSVWKREL